MKLGIYQPENQDIYRIIIDVTRGDLKDTHTSDKEFRAYMERDAYEFIEFISHIANKTLTIQKIFG